MRVKWLDADIRFDVVDSVLYSQQSRGTSNDTHDTDDCIEGDTVKNVRGPGCIQLPYLLRRLFRLARLLISYITNDPNPLISQMRSEWHKTQKDLDRQTQGTQFQN